MSHKKFVDAVVKSFDEHPEDWVFDGFRAVNSRAKIIVWLANGRYGLSVNEVGGVTFVSAFFGWCIPWRVRVWNAAMRAQALQIGRAT